MYYYIAKCEHGDVRLYGSSYSTIGIVSLCINGTWGTICGDKWDNNDASVVCKHLGYSHYGKYIYVFHYYYIYILKELFHFLLVATTITMVILFISLTSIALEQKTVFGIVPIIKLLNHVVTRHIQLKLHQ